MSLWAWNSHLDILQTPPDCLEIELRICRMVSAMLRMTMAGWLDHQTCSIRSCKDSSLLLIRGEGENFLRNVSWII